MPIHTRSEIHFALLKEQSWSNPPIVIIVQTSIWNDAMHPSLSLVSHLLQNERGRGSDRDPNCSHPFGCPILQPSYDLERKLWDETDRFLNSCWETTPGPFSLYCISMLETPTLILHAHLQFSVDICVYSQSVDLQKKFLKQFHPFIRLADGIRLAICNAFCDFYSVLGSIPRVLAKGHKCDVCTPMKNWRLSKPRIVLKFVIFSGTIVE